MIAIDYENSPEQTYSDNHDDGDDYNGYSITSTTINTLPKSPLQFLNKLALTQAHKSKLA